MSIRSLIALAFLACAGLELGAQPNPQPPIAPPKTDVPKAKLEDLNLVIAGQLIDADPKDLVRNTPAKVHAIKMLKGQSYVIDLVSTDFDSYLRLVDSADKQLAEDDDGGGNLNSRIRFSPEKDDTYLIYASRLGGGEGSYTLSVKTFIPAPLKVVALPAPTAKKPSEHQGQLAINDPPCAYRDRPGKVHAVEFKAGKVYVIDLISQQFDCYLLLQDAKGTILDQNDDGGDNLNSRIRFTAPADGTFRLVATSFNGQNGAYTLRVAEE